MPAPKGHPNYNIEGIGRPRKYDDDFIENEAIALYKWIATTDEIYFKQFAFERGFSPSKLTVFAERSEIFREALDHAHEWQQCRLVKGGLTKEFDSGFTKFVLARNHGWVEAKNINITSNEPNTIVDLILQTAGTSTGLVNDKKPAP